MCAHVHGSRFPCADVHRQQPGPAGRRQTPPSWRRQPARVRPHTRYNGSRRGPSDCWSYGYPVATSSLRSARAGTCAHLTPWDRHGAQNKGARATHECFCVLLRSAAAPGACGAVCGVAALQSSEGGLKTQRAAWSIFSGYRTIKDYYQPRPLLGPRVSLAAKEGSIAVVTTSARLPPCVTHVRSPTTEPQPSRSRASASGDRARTRPS